jgi:three-Cys-motif partner protein
LPGQDTNLGSDGLPVLVQGSWSQDKLYFVRYFSSLFNGGMKKRWPTRAYVDLFAGPGLCKDRDTGAEFDGSPLAALDCQTPFTHLFFNDINKDFVDALSKRQERLHPQANAEYLNLDCNQAAQEIAGKIPRGALTLAFIDPWNYALEFGSLAHLGQREATDLIVTFHTGAIKRNARRELAAVDAFLGDQNWKARYFESQDDVSRSATESLIDTFRNGLRSNLGYTEFGDPMPIKNSTGLPIFYLLFASKHPRGLDFWEKSSKKLRSGQRVML